MLKLDKNIINVLYLQLLITLLKITGVNGIIVTRDMNGGNRTIKNPY